MTIQELDVPDFMKKISILAVFILSVFIAHSANAQYGEPELQEIISPKNLYDEGYKSGLGFTFGLNDFGFGAGIQYRRGFSPYLEGLLNFKIAGLRDPREQTHIDFYFGNRTIASKYNRVITFPVTVGMKRRLFAENITDNFRVHTAMSIGPSFAAVIPYFRDFNANGYREDDIFTYGVFGVEPVNDIFTGWSDTEWELGWTGEIVLGIDFGDNFAKLQTLQFGYSFYYFDQGLQILEPNAPRILPNGTFAEVDADGFPVFPDGFDPANDRVSYFGSAQITFIVGWMFD